MKDYIKEFRSSGCMIALLCLLVWGLATLLLGQSSWNATTSYSVGTVVTYGTHTYQATQPSRGANPAQRRDVWADRGVVTTGPTSPATHFFGPYTLTPAQVANLFTTPYLLVSAQGPGTIIAVTQSSIENNVAGVAYSGGGTTSFFLGSHAVPPSFPSTFFTSPTTPVVSVIPPTTYIGASGTLTAPSAVVNQPLYFSNIGVAFSGGSGNIIISGFYTVLTGF